MTPAAAVLIGLAEEVAKAEKSLEGGPLYWATRKVQDVARDVAEGRSMNSLGELQSTGAAFDVAIARLEQAATAFTAALRALQGEALAGSESDWLNHTIEASPRLTSIRLHLIEGVTR
jgi:hypothetical protein